MNTKNNYYELFSRNIGIITEIEQQILQNSKIAIAGLGGVGGLQLVTLARAGIGCFIIADPEKFNLSDRNRQYGALESSRGKQKAVVMRKIIKDINSNCKIISYSDGINKNNLDGFVKNADLIIDAIEYFSLKEKVFLYQTARKYKKYVITSPIFGFATSVLAFSPCSTTFEEYFDLNNNKDLIPEKLFPILPDYIEAQVYQDIRNKKRPIPSFSCTTALSASLLCTEVVLYLLKRKTFIEIPKLIYFDSCNKIFNIVDTKWNLFWTDFSRNAYDYISCLTENKKMLSRIASFVDNNKNVLDAGCGTGNLIAEICDKSRRVLGIDFSDGMIKEAKKKTRKKKNVVIQKGNVYKFAIKDNTFDVVTSVNVLFNLENPYQAILEAYRVLKIGGTFIVSSVMKDKGVSDETRKLIFEDCQKNKIPVDNLKKVWNFQKQLLEEDGFKFKPSMFEICKLLEKASFEVKIKETTYYSNNFLIKAIKK